jgi:hypothetical protein
MFILSLRNIMQKGHEQNDGQERETALPEWLELVRKQVNSLKFGTVQITVHDSHVTQVEKLEKVRLDRPNPNSTR